MKNYNKTLNLGFHFDKMQEWINKIKLCFNELAESVTSFQEF